MVAVMERLKDSYPCEPQYMIEVRTETPNTDSFAAVSFVDAIQGRPISVIAVPLRAQLSLSLIASLPITLIMSL